MPHIPLNSSPSAPPSRATRWLGLSLLAGWLLYSAAALGWHLANDPFLSQYICGVR